MNDAALPARRTTTHRVRHANARTLAALAACLYAANAYAQPATTSPHSPSVTPASAKQAAPLEAPDGFVWPALMVGDAAPSLVVDEWLKGEPVALPRSSDRGNDAPSENNHAPVVVVEFWALWCGPCLAGFGHLSELQSKYHAQGLRIVGVTGPERNNDLEGVKAYLSANSDRTAFTFAWDIERKTYSSYMIAAARNAIPCSFVIDRNGRIAYIGHPSRLNPVLEAIFEGSFDIAAAREAYKQRILAKAQGQTLIADYRAALANKQWESCVALGTRLGELDSEEFGVWTANAFGCVLNGLNDPARAAAMGETLLAENHPLARHAEVLERVASLVADYGESLAGAKKDEAQPDSAKPGAPTSSQRVLDLGLVAANRSIDIAGRNAITARTLARVHWARGERQKALDTLDALIADERSDFRVKMLRAMRDHWAKQMQGE